MSVDVQHALHHFLLQQLLHNFPQGLGAGGRLGHQEGGVPGVWGVLAVDEVGDVDGLGADGRGRGGGVGGEGAEGNAQGGDAGGHGGCGLGAAGWVGRLVGLWGHGGGGCLCGDPVTRGERGMGCGAQVGKRVCVQQMLFLAHAGLGGMTARVS